jgi:hypothetical protein
MFQEVLAKHSREIVEILQKYFREVADNFHTVIAGMLQRYGRDVT